MYGLIGSIDSTWGALGSWLSPAHVLGVVILGLFLVLHVIVVRFVIRPMDGPGRVMATRERRVREPASVQPQVQSATAMDRRSASRRADLLEGRVRPHTFGNTPDRGPNQRRQHRPATNHRAGQEGEPKMALTVLVPLDGSPLSRRALPFAAHLVAGGRGRLVLAHVQSSFYSDIPSYYDPAQDVDALRQEGVEATSFVYRAPLEDMAEVLDLAIREAAADLVVMSTHGRGGLRRTILGQRRRPAHATSRSTGPVGSVSIRGVVAGTASHSILVPLDGSPLAEQALAPAAGMARLLDAEILLVRVLSPVLHPRYRGDKLTLSCADFVEVEDAWRYLSGVADELRAGGCRTTFWVLVGSPAVAIESAARAEGADLIVMTTHGRGGLGRFLMGSTADGLLQRSHVPILLVRSGAANDSTTATATAMGVEIVTEAHGFAVTSTAKE